MGMSSFAAAATLDLKVTNTIKASLKSMFDVSELLSRATLDQLILAICQKLDALSPVTLLPQRRTVKVIYRGHRLERQVKSIPQQVGLEVAACWKGRAVEEGWLRPTWAEKLLIGTYNRPALSLKLQMSLPTATFLARDEGDKAFKALEGGSDAEMPSSLKPSMQRCEAIDNEWAVEAVLVDNICGDGAKTLLVPKCLEQLPTAENALDLETCLQQVVSLSDGSLHKLAPKGAQMTVSLVFKLRGCMLEHRQPDWSEGGTPRSDEDDHRSPAFLLSLGDAGLIHAARTDLCWRIGGA